MTTARDSHTATLLPNGTVLVAGGENAVPQPAPFPPIYQYLAGAETYDPAAGTWTITGSMTTERIGHTAALLPNGTVLVAGGQSDVAIFNTVASAEIYDPRTGTWTATGSMATARAMHTATLLPNGTVLVTGGESDTPSSSSLASAEIYDPMTGTWTAAGSMITARTNHTATLLPNGTVLATGGYDCCASPISNAETYDPAKGAWIATGKMATDRFRQTATLLLNGAVVTAGGVDERSAPFVQR
jgi:N-acetylneuraminic acid mutarotase